MKSIIFSLLFTFTALISFAQEAPIDSNTIKGQFDKIQRISTNYQAYKVISKEGFQILKSNVLDTLKTAKKIIIEKENLLKVERDNVKKIQTQLNETKINLETASKRENSISLFGQQLNKTTYNLILWLLIITLIIGLGYFVFKFSKSNILTKEAQENLEDIHQEFETHKKKSLEREQKLRRQLQDEVNKHRNL
jgi:ATP-dependent Zn protease